MKLQHQGQTLRFRIDEAELAVLLGGGRVDNRLRIPGGPELCQSLTLAAGEAALLDATPSHWRVALPQAATQAYGRRLPCREGLEFHMAAAGDGPSLRLVFEVDVRDSTRVRAGAVRDAAVPTAAPASGELRLGWLGEAPL